MAPFFIASCEAGPRLFSFSFLWLSLFVSGIAFLLVIYYELGYDRPLPCRAC